MRANFSFAWCILAQPKCMLPTGHSHFSHFSSSADAPHNQTFDPFLRLQLRPSNLHPVPGLAIPVGANALDRSVKNPQTAHNLLLALLASVEAVEKIALADLTPVGIGGGMDDFNAVVLLKEDHVGIVDDVGATFELVEVAQEVAAAVAGALVEMCPADEVEGAQCGGGLDRWVGEDGQGPFW